MDIDELKITAQLAHINLNDDELKEAFPAFNEMLSFFSAMKNAPAAREGGRGGFAIDSSFLRADTPRAADAAESGLLLEKAAERDGRFIVIPNVL